MNPFLAALGRFPIGKLLGQAIFSGIGSGIASRLDRAISGQAYTGQGARAFEQGVNAYYQTLAQEQGEEIRMKAEGRDRDRDLERMAIDQEHRAAEAEKERAFQLMLMAMTSPRPAQSATINNDLEELRAAVMQIQLDDMARERAYQDQNVGERWTRSIYEWLHGRGSYDRDTGPIGNRK